MEHLLRQQWSALRGWLEEVDVIGNRQLPSGLGSWSVGELVAHLGLGLGMVADVSAAPADAEPMSLGRYVAAYQPAARSIAEMTRELALSLSDDLLGGIDAIAEKSWRALDDQLR